MSQIGDDRLGQPKGRLTGYFGVVEYRLEKCADTQRKASGFNGFTYKMMENVRARLAGGQYALSHVASMLKVSPYSVKRASEVLGIKRCYTDMAGRKHLFFTHGEMSNIAHFLRDAGKKRYTEEEIRERFIRESKKKQKRWMMSRSLTGDDWMEAPQEAHSIISNTEDLEIPF